MVKILPFSRYEALILMILPIILFYFYSELSLLLKFSAIILLGSCIYTIGKSFSYNEQYIEKNFFGKKRKLLLRDIISVKKGFHLGTYIIQSKNKKFLFFIIDLSFQKKKRDLLFEYIKKENPNCKFYSSVI